MSFGITSRDDGQRVQTWYKTLQGFKSLKEHFLGSASGRLPTACVRTPAVRPDGNRQSISLREAQTQPAERAGERRRQRCLHTFVRMVAAAARCSTVTSARGWGCGLARATAGLSACRGTRKKVPICDLCTLTLTSRSSSDSAPALSNLPRDFR